LKICRGSNPPALDIKRRGNFAAAGGISKRQIAGRFEKVEGKKKMAGTRKTTQSKQKKLCGCRKREGSKPPVTSKDHNFPRGKKITQKSTGKKECGVGVRRYRKKEDEPQQNEG